MTGDVRHVALNSETDFSAVAEEVCADKQPRVLERDGRRVAAIVTVDDLEKLLRRRHTPEEIQRSLDAAGAWSDVDAEELKAKIYKWRHESPPSEPVSWC